MAIVERLGTAHPRVEVEVFHSYHHSATDLQGLPRFMDRIDVYVPELLGWAPQHLEELRIISRGRVDKNVIKTAPELTNSQRFEHLTLYGTKKPVTIVDFPHGYQAEDLRTTDRFHSMTALANQIIQSQRYDTPLDFAEIMERADSMMRRKSDTNKGREDHMVSEFDPAVITLIESSRQLQRQDTIRVGMQLGVYHTRVPNELRRKGYHVEQTFANDPTAYPHSMLAEQAVLLEKPLDRELLAQAVLTGIVYKLIETNNHGDDSNNQAMMMYNVVSAFSYDDIQTLIEGYLQSGDPDHYQEYFQQAFLEDKGIVIPRTEKQLNKFLDIEDPSLVHAGGKNRKKTIRSKKRRR